MKVSRRELTLLFVVLGLGIAYLLYAFAFLPLLKDIAASGENLSYSQSQFNSYRQTTEQYDIDQLRQEQQDRLAEIEAAAQPLLPRIDDGEITAFINQIAQAQGIRVVQAVFSAQEVYDTADTAGIISAATYPLKQAAEAFRSGNETGQQTWSPAPASEAASNAASTPLPLEQNPTAVNRQLVEIQLNGVTYSQIFGFMQLLDATRRTIYLTSMSIEESPGEDGGLRAALTYSFVQVDKLTDTDTGFAEVSVPSGAGKTDPFAGIAPAALPQPQDTQPLDSQP